MDLLFSAIMGGFLGGLGSLVLYLMVKDPAKRKKMNVFAILPAVIAVPLLNQSPLKVSIIGYFSPSYKIQARMLEKLNPLFEDERVKGELIKGKDHAYAYAFLLTQQGIKHLDDDDLDQWNNYRIKLAERHPKFCSGLLKGNINEEIIFSAFSELKDNEMNEFLDIMIKGANRKLNNEGKPQSHVTYLQDAVKDIHETLDEEEKVRFFKVYSNPDLASVDDSCWATLKLLKGTRNLPVERRSKVYKVMAGI